MKRRRKVLAYASTGSHFGPWVQEDGRLAIFETYAQALRDSVGPGFVHRVEIWVEQEPADPRRKTPAEKTPVAHSKSQQKRFAAMKVPDETLETDTKPQVPR